MIMNLFSSRPDHPLGDPREFKRVLVELPLDNAFKAVDEVYGWFESLQQADDFRLDRFFDVVRQLDEAAQPHVRRLTRDYLHSARLSKSEERRMWTLCYNYWGEVSSLYARCLERAMQNPKDKGSEALKSSLPLAATRLLAARATQLKWVVYRYGPIGEDLWRGLGQPYLAAEAAGYAQKPVPLYPGQPGLTSVAQQYLQALIFHSSSMDSLMPLEIELADRLSANFQPGFVFSKDCLRDSVYWVDAASGLPPIRMARQPDSLLPTLRFFSPGTAPQALNELMRSVERGEVPADLNLGGEYLAKVLLPVLRHLAMYWAPKPPQREHARHAVKTRMAVLQGFDDCFTVFAGDVARFGKEHTAESWVVENVSRGGFGAGIDDLGGDWLKIGALISMQPEGGENWVLGVVRRYKKDSDVHASVGIQTLSRQAQSVELRPRTSGFSATGAIPGIWLREGNAPGATRMVLPPASFDLRESLEFAHDGRRYLLTPVEREDIGSNFEIGHYRESVSD
ncbi:hypothetical protein [Propionivibrio sp.]|uniref:hypothetical protein n=1 Tax=Propionivibrio sp. TaxID=2212460 RepID=UPI003BF0B124